jgi:hypothetical protein
MIKNIFLPLLLILLTSAGTVYLWHEDSPLNLFGLVGFFTMGIGSMYISYFIFYKIFPDKRNKPLPPIQDLMLMAEYKIEKGKPQVMTKGAAFGTLMAVVMMTSGIYGWIRLADKYEEYELNSFGMEANAIIIDIGNQKGIGTFRAYEYYDKTGSRFVDKFSNKTFNIGDTITILYSTNRPIINKVTTFHDDE